MSLRIGWLSPFTPRTGVGTFSKAVTDALPDTHAGQAIDLTVIAPMAPDLYPTRHRVIDIATTAPDSGFYDLFDLCVFNAGNNMNHHREIFGVMRQVPGVVICHDHVYQHFLATLIHERGRGFADYVALVARYGSAAALETVQRSGIARGRGLHYAPWDSEVSGAECLGAPLLHLASALVVHSAFAEAYARGRFAGPVLRLGMPVDQRGPRTDRPAAAREDAQGRRVIVSFGHVQSTKCIDDVLAAIARSARLREGVLFVVSGFAADRRYIEGLRAYVDEHDLADCVRFDLDLTDAALDALSERADGFVNLRFPNTEGASVSLIEQLATGKPVVVFDTGCYAEVPDDAALKVAVPRDVEAIRSALERMLGDPQDLAALGARGAAHARRFDCRGYGAALLDFLRAEHDLLRRRAAHRACRLLGFGAAGTASAPADEAWRAGLATARTTFDLLDRGRLALDPDILREVGPERIAGYAQAAILRSRPSPRLEAALRDYFRGGQDLHGRARVLHIVAAAVYDDDPEATGWLPEVCPLTDFVFWEVIAALGPRVLATLCHRAVLDVPAPEGLCDAADADEPALRMRLADALAARARQVAPADPGALEAVLQWLRDVRPTVDLRLEALPVGRGVVVGSAEHRRYLRLSGFFQIEPDHAWSGPERGLIYLRPAPGATRVVLSGHALDDRVGVSVSAHGASAVRPVRPRRVDGRVEFELDLADLGLAEAREPGAEPVLCLSVESRRCRSPAELGLSGDTRPLGYCLKHVAVR